MLEEKKGIDKDVSQRSGFCQREPKPIRFSRYTTLNTHKSRVLEEALPPKKSQTPSKVNMKKYYKYHRNYDHIIDYYTTLRDKVEQLIQVGFLKMFMKLVDNGRSEINYQIYNDKKGQR